MGDHSHSWLMADDILSSKPPVVERTGIIPLDVYPDFLAEGKPMGWFSGISGPNVKVSEPENIDKDTTHVRVTWDADLSVDFEYFISEVRRLKELHGEVRFVFGFDS